MRLRFALVYGPQKPHVMILGVLDVPDICIEGWCKQFGPVLKFQNHHFSPYIEFDVLLDLLHVVFSKAHSQTKCKSNRARTGFLHPGLPIAYVRCKGLWGLGVGRRRGCGGAGFTVYVDRAWYCTYLTKKNRKHISFSVLSYASI